MSFHFLANSFFREIEKKIEKKCKDMGCSFILEPRISGVKRRPDFIIKDTRGREAIVEIKSKTLHLEDLAEIVDMAKNYSEVKNKSVKACLITLSELSPAVAKASQKYNIRVVPYTDFDSQFNINTLFD